MQVSPRKHVLFNMTFSYEIIHRRTHKELTGRLMVTPRTRESRYICQRGTEASFLHCSIEGKIMSYYTFSTWYFANLQYSRWEISVPRC